MSSTAKAVRFAWSSRRAWWFTATARTKERFARTALGSFWLGLSNLLSISVLATVYGTVFKVKDFNTYVVYLGTGLVVWNTIAGSIQSSPSLFKINAVNIKNTHIHPIFYTLEEWAFQVQTFFQSFGLVLLVLMVFQPTLAVHLLCAGVLPILNLLLFIYWVPLLICLIGAKYEDIFQIVPIVLQLMFLLTPILYKKEALGALAWTANCNAIYRILENLRSALIEGDLNLVQNLSILFMNLIGLYCSARMLSSQKRYLPFLV